jgi:hypothetical protein
MLIENEHFKFKEVKTMLAGEKESAVVTCKSGSKPAQERANRH